MSFLGSLISGVSEIAGGVAEFAIKSTGEIVGAIAEELGEDDIAEKSRFIGDNLGKVTNEVTCFTGNITGKAVDTIIDVSSSVGEEIGGIVAQSYGGNETDIEEAKKVGKVIGGALGGLAVGEVAGAAITSITSATGIASTGTSISTLHGVANTNATLAHIGGGSLASGGGGIAAGQGVLNTISVSSTLVGGISAGEKNVAVAKSQQPNIKKLNKNVKTVNSYNNTFCRIKSDQEMINYLNNSCIPMTSNEHSDISDVVNSLKYYSKYNIMIRIFCGTSTPFGSKDIYFACRIIIGKLKVGDILNYGNCNVKVSSIFKGIHHSEISGEGNLFLLGVSPDKGKMLHSNKRSSFMNKTFRRNKMPDFLYK